MHYFGRFLLMYTGIICMSSQEALSLRILGIFPYQGKSHFFVFKVFLEELAKRGHDVTVISHFPDSKSGYRDISLVGTVDILEDEFTADRPTFLATISFLNSIANENCEKMLEVKDVQDLWKTKEKFDVVVTELFNSDCSLGLAYALGAPVVSLTSHVLFPWHYKRFGIPDNPSFTPSHFLEGGSKPTFYQRIESIVFGAYANLLYKFGSQRSNERTLAKYFDDIPPLEELGREVKFVLLYHNFPLTGSRLFPSNVIEVGGFHVAKPKPLTGELANFIEGSEHGVVYVSFGSVIKTSTLKEDKLMAIVGALSQLKQRVVWKWENKTLPGSPENILTMSWLPQNDILAHPKVLAFFSHGGMLGTTEAIHHGVPMVAMPFLGDQPSNAAAIKESGLGVFQDFNELDSENLLAALKKVLQPEFNEQVKTLSKIWHDRPLSAIDTAVFWTEFAARNCNFTFRTPAADVPFYQYHNLDVLAVFLLAVTLVLYPTYKCCCGRSKVKSINKEKKRKKRD